MMNNFSRFKKSPDVLFDNQPMFHNVTFGICVRMMRRKNSKVFRFRSIFDPEFKSRMIYSSPIAHVLGIAWLRAEFLSLRLGCKTKESLFTGSANLFNLTIPPSMGDITRLGTIFSKMNFISVKNKLFPAFKADRFHSETLPHYLPTNKDFEEKYCEIAAKRMSQEVFDFKATDSAKAQTNE